MFKHDNEGFSLIELLVVVALIAILAAVAGPQLLAYNLQGANAIAAADLRNAAAAEKAFFAEWGVYASSQPGGSPGNGSILLFGGSTGRIWAHDISSTAPSVTIPEPGFSPGVSQNVALKINTSAAGGSYTMVSKNTLGDRCFGMDSDSQEIYWVNGLAGSVLMPADNFTVVAGANDFVIDGIGSFPAGACIGLPGQTSWTAL